MAIRVTLPGRGAIDFDVETARILQVGTLDAADAQEYVDATNPDQDTVEKVIDATAVPKSYVDLGDIRRWDTTVFYAAQEYVVHDGRLYFANEGNMGVTPMPRPNEVTQWSELERQDFFLQITADDGTILTANDHQHNVTITGGTGIATSADTDSETLAINLNAGLEDLSNVSNTTPLVNQILEYDGTNWVPVNNTGGGYSIVSADNGDDVEVTNTRETINITGGDSSNPVSTTITSNDTETNVEISVAEVQGGTGGVPGLISVTDKDLLDDVRDGGYSNSDLSIGTLGANLTFNDSGTGRQDLIPLAEVLSVNNVVIFSDIPAESANMQADTPYNVYIFTRSTQAIGMDGLHRWEVNAITPTTVVDATQDRGTSDRFRIIPNTQNHFQLTWDSTSINSIVSNHNTTLLAVRFQGTSRSDPTQEYFGISTGGNISNIGDLNDVTINSPEADQVLAWNGSAWVNANPADIEEHGGRAWNNTASYSQGDIVSFEVSGVDHLYISVTDNNRSNQPFSNGVTSPQWQEANILRLRNIANVDIPTDPNDNDLLVWNATESEWMVMTPEMVVQLTTAITQGDIERNAFNEIDAINIGGIERPIRQNAKSGNALPPMNVSTAGDIFVLEGSSGFHTDNFVASDGVITTEVSGDTVLRFTGTENLEDYIHSSDVAVRVNGIPYPPTGKELNPNAGQYQHSFGIQVIGQPPTLDFTDPTDIGPDDRIEFTYRAGAEVDNAGVYYRNADNTGWIKDSSDSEFRHGTRLPATGTTGDGFILTATDGTDTPGYYYYTTEWVKDDTDTAYTAGAGLRLSPGLEFSVDNPLLLWNATTIYEPGDQVLFTPPEGQNLGNIPSLYISLTSNNMGNIPVNTVGGTDQTNWRLLRSGLVEVRTNGIDEITGVTDLGDGITANSTLVINGGDGISVTRRGTAFGINQHGTGHSDVDDFGPGWGYSFYDLRDGDSLGAVDGSVEESIGGFAATDITLLTGSDVPVIQGTDNTSGLTNNSIYGFLTNAGAQNQALFPGDPATMRRIVYVTAIFAGGSVWNLAILNTDPRFNTRGDLNTATGASTARIISTTFTLYPLSVHHDTPSNVPADWARQGNTDQIPLDKLQGLNQNFSVTRTAATQDDELLVFDAGDDSSLTLLPHTVEGLTDTTITSPQAGQVLARNSDNDAWINMSVEEMAAGRLEFTDRGNNIWDTTGFITDPTTPNTVTPIRTTTFTNNLLRFQLATAANLALTVPNYPAFNWDQTVSGTLTATATRDDLLNVDLTDLTTTASNVTIAPSTGVGPWSVRYTDPSQITSPAGATSTAGGSVAGVTFSAQYSNDATRSETDTGLAVRWLNTGLNVGNRNYGTTRTFLQQYPSYTIPVSCNNLSNNGTVTWSRVDGTYNATASINGGETASIGVGNYNISIPLTVSHNDTVATETVVAEFIRPITIVPTRTAFGVSDTVTNQPIWNYPLFTFSATGTAAPVAVTIRDATQHGGSTNPSNAIGTQVSGLSLTNSGSSARFLYVAYPAASSDTPSAGDNFVVRLISTVGGVRGEAQNVTIASANLSSAPLNIFRDGGTAAEGEMYNWFRVLVGAGNSVDLVEVNPS